MSDKYFAFCFCPRGQAIGGWNDCIGQFDTLEAAYKAVEEKALTMGYWPRAEGHIVIAGGDICEPIRWYAAKLQGNIYGAKIVRSTWAMSKNDRLLEEIRNSD